MREVIHMSPRTWKHAENGMTITTASAELDYPWETEDVQEVLEDDQEPDQGEGDPQAYDPSQHTVDEVLAELERVADDEAAVTRIVEAEKAGKARKGIIAAREQSE